MFVAWYHQWFAIVYFIYLVYGIAGFIVLMVILAKICPAFRMSKQHHVREKANEVKNMPDYKMDECKKEEMPRPATQGPLKSE